MPAAYQITPKAAGFSDVPKYCMFVDVDEFWVADPFPRTIQTFMKDVGTCDCISFQWVNIFNENLFARPLASSGKIGINPHVKSLVRYDSEYIRFGAHAPTIANIESPRTHLGRDPVANHKKTPTGYAVHQVTPVSLMPKLQDRCLGWIFHRYSRSEIEFSYRIFKVHANDDINAVSFKTNRKGGYLAKSENSMAESSFLERVFDESSITAYHNSLREFEGKCGVSADIELARSKISEASVLKMLEGIPEDIFERDHKVLLTAFAGTRFYDYILNRKS